MSVLIRIAVNIACEGHAGQLDKAGRPYILHPLRVGAAGKTLGVQLVGFLHDVVEDSNITVDFIEREFDKEIATAVDAMTKRQGEPYLDFVRRCAQNYIAREVKLLDIADNTSKPRLELLPLEEQHRLWKKYEPALKILEGRI